MSDLNWCSCGKATQPQSLYCSVACKEKEDHPAVSLSNWSLDGLMDTDNAAPIAFYPHNHLQNVLLQSPRSPFINPSFLPPSTITPTTNPTASPRFTGGSANNGGGGGGGTRSSNQSARSSPFAFTSTPLNNNTNTSSIPFLALPMSEIELPPPQQQLQLQQQKGRKHSTAPLISSPFSQPIPNNNTTAQRGISSPFMNPRLLSSPKLNGRIIPQSPYLNGSNDFSSTGGPDGGMVTVAGASANAEDMLVSLAFNNRSRK